MKRSPAPLLPLWFAAFLIACNGSNSAPDAGPSASCLEAENHSDLDWLEDNVFTPSCASFTPCHKGRALSANELNLEKGNVRANLLNVPHAEFTDQILVVAGEPENSYLMVLLGDRPGPLNDEGTMPYNNPLLCQQKRDAISRWITSLGTEPDAGVPDAGGPDGAIGPDAASADGGIGPDAGPTSDAVPADGQ